MDATYENFRLEKVEKKKNSISDNDLKGVLHKRALSNVSVNKHGKIQD